MALSMDSILKKPAPQKIFMLIGLLLMIAVLYYVLLGLPRQREFDTQKMNLEKLNKEKYENQLIARDLQKYQGEVDKLHEDLFSALTQIPNEQELPDILKNISIVGKESNLEFTLFKPKPEQPISFYASVPFELVLIGGYHNVGLFFDRVSKLPRIINIVDFTMVRAANETKDVKAAKTAKAKDEPEILVKTTCLLNTYRWIEKRTEEKAGGKKTVKKGSSKETEDEKALPKTNKK